MSKQVLQMKYHPARKEIEFHRFQSNVEMPICKDSKLKKYENKRGHFVLQDHGNSFLSDIAKTFDGERMIDIEVITTKNDYEDFMQMVEFFNNSNNSQIQINATLLAELPDMDTTYRTVKEHGEKAVNILERYKKTFYEIDMRNPEVRQVVDNFASDVRTEVDSITKKIEALAENNVNICFAGVYSAGKSALINAILGYAILPESIQSETARMFRIQSPKSGDAIRIVFSIRDNHTELIWDDSKSVFEFVAGPVESTARKSIQDTVNENKAAMKHKQIYEILKTLNGDNDVSADISVYFPIPLDNDKLQFTIYDTPGTDSNYGDHQTVLQDALSEQTHSILIFVAAPNKLEGEGNNALLNYIHEAEKKDSKTSIDIGRSLFVINWADSTDLEARTVLQGAEITDKNNADCSIKLADKKLFFTSAKIAYAAKSKQNKIAGKAEDYTIRQYSNIISDPEQGRYYQQNHCATSEYSTRCMIDFSTQALEKAEASGDSLEVLHICSGVFALEREINLYGEKFATAVRAFAIIDSVDKALSKMNKNVQALDKQNQKSIEGVNKEIADLKKAVADGISAARSQSALQQGEKLPDDILKNLHLDGDYITKNFISEPITFFEKLLRGRFGGLGKVKYQAKQKQEITQKTTSILQDFTKNFKEERAKLLTQQRDSFIEAVKGIIKENGSLSEEAKNYLLEIRPPEIDNRPSSETFEGIYDACKRTKKFFWVTVENIDKEQFIEEATSELQTITSKLQQDFEEDYRKSLCSIIFAVESEFNQNLAQYSVLLKAMIKDKEALEKLRIKVSAAVQDLRNCQDDLNKVIWREKE